MGILLNSLPMGDIAVIVTAVSGVITAVGVPLVAYLIKSLNDKQDIAAKEVTVVKQTLEGATTSTTKSIAAVSDKLNAVHGLTEELEKQGNSRWDKIEKELIAARLEIRTLQQSRVDDAKNRTQ